LIETLNVGKVVNSIAAQYGMLNKKCYQHNQASV